MDMTLPTVCKLIKVLFLLFFLCAATLLNNKSAIQVKFSKNTRVASAHIASRLAGKDNTIITPALICNGKHFGISVCELWHLRIA